MASTDKKARYWVGILYPENMIPNWQDEISNKLQVPFAYCIHDKDVESDGKTPRKAHVHIIMAFSNTTTYKHAMDVYNELSAEGKCAINTCQAIIGIRNQYDYLIHDTDDCRKKGKYQYSVGERVTGNNFDIGSYEQLSVADKQKMVRELCNYIATTGVTNFTDFYMAAVTEFDDSYFEVIMTYSGLFERLTKGNYQKLVVQNMTDQTQG